MTEFEERYKSFDNKKLLSIINEAENYKSAAVEAAKVEVLRRKISEEEISLVEKEILEKKLKVEERQKKVRKVEGEAKAIGTEFLETINPIQKHTQTADRKINLLVIIFGVMSIYQIYSELGMIKFIFMDSLSNWDFSVITYFISIFFLPVAITLFWKRNKVGWVLMNSFFIYIIIGAIGVLLLSLKWRTEKQVDNFSSGDIQFELIEMENIYSQFNPVTYLSLILVFSVTLWFVNKKEIRKVFEIDNKSALTTIILSGLIISFLVIIS